MFRRIIRAVLCAVLTLGGIVAMPDAAWASTSMCSEDGGYRVQLCIYQDASVDYMSGGSEYIQVVRYRFKVVNLDPHTTVINPGSLAMLATVDGYCVSGCSGYQRGQVARATVSGLVSGKVYTLNVPWKNATIRINDSDGNSVQAARADVHFYFRAKATTFASEPVCTGTTTWGLCG